MKYFCTNKVCQEFSDDKILFGNQYTEVTTNNSKTPQVTQEQLASQMGISVDTLQNYKMLADMIPELEDLGDTGIVTKDTAFS